MAFLSYSGLLMSSFLILTSGMSVKVKDDDDDAGAFMAVQLEVANDLPPDCQDQFQLPGKAISGQDVDWTFLCSGQLLESCKEVMLYTFTLEFTDEEKETVDQILHAVTVTGANYVCLNETRIQSILDGGGRNCIMENNRALFYCSYVSILKFATGNDPESLCRTLDHSYECAIKAISSCNDTQLEDLWSNYYKRIIDETLCERYTLYKYVPNKSSSFATKETQMIMLLLTFLIILLSKARFS